ncbi:MAG: hypothetical protein ACRDDZ_12855 [Marinifilaceae bacterium]
MTLKNIYPHCIAIIFYVIMACSCRNEIIVTPTDSDEITVSFNVSGSPVPTPASITRATLAIDNITEYENTIDINQFKVYLFANNTNIEFQSLYIYANENIPNTYQVIGKLVLPSNLLNKPVIYRAEVFANCGNNPAYATDITYNFDATNYSPYAGSNIKYIPMWGVSTQTLTFKNGTRVDLNNIQLLRSMSKIEFNLAETLLDEYYIESITLNQFNNKGYCLPPNSTQIENITSSPNQTNIPSTALVTNALPFKIEGNSAYAYVPEFQSTTSLTYNIKLYSKFLNQSKTFTMTYNPQAITDYNQIIRNYIYNYQIKTTKGNIDCVYTIRDWTTKESTVDNIDIHWLWVKDDTLYMNNISSTGTIFDTSLPGLTYTIKDVMNYKENTAWTGGGTITVNIDRTSQGNISINSPVPTNFKGKEFTITITNSQNRSVNIKVYQFPPLYVNTVTTGVTWSDNSGQTNKNMYVFTALLPDLSTIPLPDEDLNFTGIYVIGSTNYYYKYYTSGTRDYLRWDLRNDRCNFLRNECSFGFPQTTLSTLTNFYSTCTNTNNTWASSRQWFASARIQTTNSSTDNNKLVSPRFMLASQAGMNISLSSYSSGTVAPYNVTQQQYCERYREFDNKGNDYGPGTWRAPTRAEVYLIDVLQNVSRCEVKGVLEGGAYFSADGVLNVFMDPRTSNIYTTGSIRCVRDIKQ